MEGFIDIHTHGANNIDVNCASVEDLISLSEFFAAHGCSAWVPTVMSQTIENMEESCRRIAEAKRIQTKGAKILGVHLEGPFLSPLFAGAMPPEFLRKCDCKFVERMQKVADGCVMRMTLAPEVDGAMEVIKEFASSMNISLGHSNATYDIAMQAFEYGANCITHCGNAMRLFHQHEPGLLGAALANDDCYIEQIGDGLHIAPSSFNVLLKIKGLKRICVITDSMSAAGLGDGEFILGGSKVIVKNGDARTLSDTRAGSVVTMDKAFENIQKFTGLSADSVKTMFNDNQKRMLGLGN